MRNQLSRLVLTVCALSCLFAIPSHAQTPVGQAPVGKRQFFTAAGLPNAGGKIYTCVAGTACPGNPLATYVDATGVSQNPNPIILDSGGFIPGNNDMWLSAASYKIVAQNSAGATQWTIDSVTPTSFLNLPNTWTALQTFSAGIAVAGSSTFTNTGVFTNTQMNEYMTSLVNGLNPGNELHIDPLYASFFNTEAITGGTAIPAGSAIINGVGVAGYVNSSCDSLGRSKCNGVGGFFRARDVVNGSAGWGINPASLDMPGLTGHHITGSEIDLGVFGSPTFVRGEVIILGGVQTSYGTMPTDSVGLEIFAASPANLKWNRAIQVDRGASSLGQGLVLEGKLTTNPTVSHSVSFSGYDSGGVAHQASILADSAGNLSLQPSAGAATAVLNNGGGLSLPGSTSGASTVPAPATGGGTNTLPQGSGTLLQTGSGAGNLLQTKRAASCTTGAAAGSTCTTTVTWPNTFADTNYTVQGCVVATPTNVPYVLNYGTKAAASIVVSIANLTAVAASGTIECGAIHD